MGCFFQKATGRQNPESCCRCHAAEPAARRLPSRYNEDACRSTSTNFPRGGLLRSALFAMKRFTIAENESAPATAATQTATECGATPAREYRLEGGGAPNDGKNISPILIVRGSDPKAWPWCALRGTGHARDRSRPKPYPDRSGRNPVLGNDDRVHPRGSRGRRNIRGSAHFVRAGTIHPTDRLTPGTHQKMRNQYG